MFTDTFWQQFWPEFFGGVASTLFLAVLTIMIGYATRLRILRAFKKLLERLHSSELL